MCETPCILQFLEVFRPVAETPYRPHVQRKGHQSSEELSNEFLQRHLLLRPRVGEKGEDVGVRSDARRRPRFTPVVQQQNEEEAVVREAVVDQHCNAGEMTMTIV